MADEVDATAERAESEAPYLLAASKKPEGPPPSGSCLWCDTKFEPPNDFKRFCDSDCRDGYERHVKLRRQAGFW